MVIAQQPAQPLVTLHRPLAVDDLVASEQQDVIFPLMIAYSNGRFRGVDKMQVAIEFSNVTCFTGPTSFMGSAGMA
jgi:hypothetical protein